MIPPHTRRPLRPRLALLALSCWALLAGLGGCGSGGSQGAGVDRAISALDCPETVMFALAHVVRRVYREGVSSERTAVARLKIARSLALRRAVESDDPAAAQAAAAALLAGGKITDLRVTAGSRVLADVGPAALAPVPGVITSAGGAPLAGYVTSVWSDEGFIAESRGIGQSRILLRARSRAISGSHALDGVALGAHGALHSGASVYQYTSFGAHAYPTGAPVRVYLLKPLAQTAPLCGHTSEDTLVNTLASVARAIYAGEAGARTLPQVRRVQRDGALLQAVSRDDPRAIRRAIVALLNQHIVRLRVSAGGRLLADVGGPYVLAPVSAPLRLRGRTIGSFVLSIQDDEGYLRLARRLAGLRVLMYMGAQLVKNSLGPDPGRAPAGGSYAYRRERFRVVTVNARSFPSGPLTIRVLIPIPYS